MRITDWEIFYDIMDEVSILNGGGGVFPEKIVVPSNDERLQFIRAVLDEVNDKNELNRLDVLRQLKTMVCTIEKDIADDKLSGDKYLLYSHRFEKKKTGSIERVVYRSILRTLEHIKNGTLDIWDARENIREALLINSKFKGKKTSEYDELYFWKSVSDGSLICTDTFIDRELFHVRERSLVFVGYSVNNRLYGDILEEEYNLLTRMESYYEKKDI